MLIHALCREVDGYRVFASLNPETELKSRILLSVIVTVY